MMVEPALCALGQTIPQAPQLNWSVWGSTQASEQLIWPMGQQRPAEQTWLPAQGDPFPHWQLPAAQLSPGRQQTPPQAVVDAGQTVPQLPSALQAEFAGQHAAPQLTGLLPEQPIGPGLGPGEGGV